MIVIGPNVCPPIVAEIVATRARRSLEPDTGTISTSPGHVWLHQISPRWRRVLANA